MADGADSMQAAAGGPVGIICGGGSMPFAVADFLAQRQRSALLFPIRGWADEAAVARYPHAWIALGQFGRFCRLARDAGVRDVVCIGTLVRPPVRSVRLDWATIRLLPQIYRLFRGGDDHLLSGIAHLFEQQGFNVLGAHEVAPEILMPEGPLGAARPSARDLADAAMGLSVIDAMGPFDIGQAVVVAERRVLGVEAAEGTDGLLARIAEMRDSGRIRMDRGVGVLVKAPKPGQDRRMDLPTIGPGTVAAAAKAGLAGVAVRAGGVLVAQPQAVAAAADAAGIFIIGVGEAATTASVARNEAVEAG